MRLKFLVALLVLSSATSASAAVIGIDAKHQFSAASSLFSSGTFATFRSTLVAAGHTYVAMNQFNASALSGIDVLICGIGYNDVPYTGAERLAIQEFTERAVFTSDKSLFANPTTGNDRPITFGDNQRLLTNIVQFLSIGRGTLFMADSATGHLAPNFNLLVAPYGVQYALDGVDGNGRTVTGIVSHPVTAGVATLGIDFQLPMTIGAPAIDLTTAGDGSGQDNILAVFGVPEPSAALLVAVCAAACHTLVRVGMRRPRTTPRLNLAPRRRGPQSAPAAEAHASHLLILG
jgi:hypothetical protein